MFSNKRVAIIDLGTNTFHLMISELRYDEGDKKPIIIFKKKQYVKLASGGINTIEEAAWKRGIETLFNYKTLIDSYDVTEVYAFGTAGLRTASNGLDFVEQVKNEIGIPVRLIDGDKEAELIWRGVRQAVNIGKETVLIVDIGGGSVEFIIANQKEVFWKQSFAIGAAVLKNVYHKQDPISVESIILLRQYIDDVLEPVRKAIKRFPCSILIGASGTFDTIVDMQLAQEGKSRADSEKDAHAISTEYFNQIYAYLIKSGLQQRLAIPGMIPERAEMIVVACILIDFILKEFDIDNIVQSEFAMKQGILWEVLYNEI